MFFQGAASSREQLCQFTNETHHVLQQDSDKIEWTFDGDPTKPSMLHNIFPQRELPYLSWKKLTWKDMFAPMILLRWIINFCLGNTHHVNKAGLTLVKSTQASIAGRIDVDESLRAINLAGEKHDALVLAGHSRGASVTIISASLLPPDVSKKVKLIILFAPFDSFDTLFYDCGGWRRLVAGLMPIYRQLFTGDYPYRFSQIVPTPLQAIGNISRDIPIAFVVSKTDKAVPKVSTDRLLAELANTGHKHVHQLVLEDATHGNLMEHEECLKFVQKLHEIYID